MARKFQPKKTTIGDFLNVKKEPVTKCIENTDSFLKKNERSTPLFKTKKKKTEEVVEKVSVESEEA